MEHKEMLYVHPAPVRVWHWINAAGFIALIITGIQIRFAETVNMFSFENAVNIHNYVGFIVIGNFGLWLLFYFGTGKIRIYFPNPRTFLSNVIKQMQYYGYGI
ncbi:MAG: cytochrome b/b6 domain-containing protein, partial [Desulfobulbaceae bacterium]|nr:cytochrome b/b6 domain-containing protein [Desulfobulbaceae bacterium]